jgi:hypothetical protein
MDWIVTLVLLAIGLAAIVVPFIAVLRWQGLWRLLALVPAGALTFVVARIVLDTAIDPTAHNLWPMELMVVGVPGLLFLGAVWLLRRWLGASESASLPRRL